MFWSIWWNSDEMFKPNEIIFQRMWYLIAIFESPSCGLIHFSGTWIEACDNLVYSHSRTLPIWYPIPFKTSQLAHSSRWLLFFHCQQHKITTQLSMPSGYYITQPITASWFSSCRWDLEVCYALSIAIGQFLTLQPSCIFTSQFYLMFIHTPLMSIHYWGMTHHYISQNSMQEQGPIHIIRIVLS